MDSPTILFHPARADGAAEIRRALQTLERLRDGWRPSRDVLAAARHVERWTVTRPVEAAVYQFIGHWIAPADHSSLVIGTLLAIAPPEGWALLASSAWVTLGPPLPEAGSFDPADVTRRAGNWLRAQRS